MFLVLCSCALTCHLIPNNLTAYTAQLNLWPNQRKNSSYLLEGLLVHLHPGHRLFRLREHHVEVLIEGVQTATNLDEI